MRRIEGPLRIALVYVLVGALWIGLSDWLVARIAPEYLHAGQTVKGLLFVALSGTLIFVLVRRELRRRTHVESEREQLETRLAGAQRLEAIGRLTGGIAHDFNNLLTAISGNIESYVSRVAGGPADPDLLELTEAACAARRAEDLTRQLLAFGRPRELRSEPVDLNDIIRDMSRLLHRLIGDRIEIVTTFEDDLWVIGTERGPLQQIVMNLALNARDAMPAGGRLTLATENVRITDDRVPEEVDFDILPGDYVRFRVEDTGKGMDAVTRDHIYEPFFTTKDKHTGTGLGMATVHAIVKEAGGCVRLDTAPGEGARFQLYFPRATRVATPRPPERPREPGHLSRTGTILVVEDDRAVRAFIVRTLQRHGFTTLECPAAPEAFDLLRSGGAIDLLLTDAVMPGMTGMELIDRARELHPDLAVILMSGYAEDEVRPDSPYLAKPFTTDRLVTRVRQALGSEAQRP